jgi:transcriptional regulator
VPAHIQMILKVDHSLLKLANVIIAHLHGLVQHDLVERKFVIHLFDYRRDLLDCRVALYQALVKGILDGDVIL